MAKRLLVSMFLGGKNTKIKEILYICSINPIKEVLF